MIPHTVQQSEIENYLNMRRVNILGVKTQKLTLVRIESERWVSRGDAEKKLKEEIMWARWTDDSVHTHTRTRVFIWWSNTHDVPPTMQKFLNLILVSIGGYVHVINSVNGQFYVIYIPRFKSAKSEVTMVSF